MFAFKRSKIAACAALGFALMNTAVIAQEDPYLWLEDVMGEKAISWVKEQNAKSQ